LNSARENGVRPSHDGPPVAQLFPLQPVPRVVQLTIGSEAYPLFALTDVDSTSPVGRNAHGLSGTGSNIEVVSNATIARLGEELNRKDTFVVNVQRLSRSSAGDCESSEDEGEHG
jgi:hypothetical protein